MMKIHITSKKIFKWVLVLIMLGFIFWGVSWATFARPPLPEAVEALESDNEVIITLEPWLTFVPNRTTPKIGFIFYPGGRINPQGYATLLRAIASEGYLVIVPEMPINMAVFNANIADKIITNYPEIDDWVIGGHSVGGTMAAQYTSQNPNTINGLAIWASYPANNADVSAFDLPVVSIYGNLDPRVNDLSITERKYLLPDKTQYVRIEGGDHHQFGSYEIKPEEQHAVISRDSQQQQIIQATLDLLKAASHTK